MPTGGRSRRSRARLRGEALEDRLARAAARAAHRRGAGRLDDRVHGQAVVGREQGRLQDLHVVMGDIVDRAAPLSAVRSALAWTLCELGLLEQARAEFEELAAHDFADLRRDVSWLPGIVSLVEVCVFLGDARRAALLYPLLLPHAGHTIPVGSAAMSFGPAAYYLGRLAATMGRHADAAAHFEDALKMSAAMGARPFLAHAQHAILPGA